jgi:hypothetical protein
LNNQFVFFAAAALRAAISFSVLMMNRAIREIPPANARAGS